MLPLKTTFERFRRLVHDLGIELDKDVELAIEGAETELDKTVIDQLNDPLVHLIRNSMDHGIETPEGRRAAGKPPTRHHSAFRAALRRPRADPGERRRRGLDVEAVRARAIEQGLIDAGRAAFRSRDLLVDPGARLFHRARGDRCFRARRGHGRGAPQRGGFARLDRDRQPARRRASP